MSFVSSQYKCKCSPSTKQKLISNYYSEFITTNDFVFEFSKRNEYQLTDSQN